MCLLNMKLISFIFAMILVSCATAENIDNRKPYDLLAIDILVQIGDGPLGKMS